MTSRSGSRSNWDRRTFLNTAIGVTGAAGAAALGQAAETPEPLCVPPHVAHLSTGGRPPFRVGFKRILDPSTGEKEPWYVNDHCFIRSRDGTWHAFGITHTEPANPQDERFLLHATAPNLQGPWKKLPPVMHFDPSRGETVIWAPYVIEHDGRYWMFYCGGGDSSQGYRIHLATSTDLHAWQRHPENPMLIDGFDARDPMVLRHGDGWILYYTATDTPQGGHHIVAAVTSHDLIHWSKRKIVFRSPKVGTFGGPTESPFVVERHGKYYLFVCTNEPYNDTAAYVSDSPLSWDPADIVATFGAHAAEVMRDSDDRWFVSAAGWGQGGLYLAELNWMSHE